MKVYQKVLLKFIVRLNIFREKMAFFTRRGASSVDFEIPAANIATTSSSTSDKEIYLLGRDGVEV